MLVIADVAGQYDALMRLCSRHPNKEIFFLGDLVDRGPKSKEVVDFAMINRCVMGNHEHMMLDFLQGGHYYESGIWDVNGGWATLKSYGGKENVPPHHIEWMRSLPYHFEDEDVFLSHAPWPAGVPLGRALEPRAFGRINPDSLLWNRDPPERRGKLQLFGHNSHWGLRAFSDKQGIYAVCLDDSRMNRITAYDTDSREIDQEPYREDRPRPARRVLHPHHVDGDEEARTG